MAVSTTYIGTSLTVDYEEIDGSPTEASSQNGFVVKRILQCAWGERGTLRRQLIGTIERYGDVIVVYKAHRYPGGTAAICSDVQTTPFGKSEGNDSDGVASYEFARLEVTYEVPTYGSDEESGEGESYASESLRPAAEFITLPNQNLYWDAAKTEPVGLEESPGKLIVMLEWQFTRHRMPYIPNDVVNLVGGVNDVAITSPSLGLIFPAETLLYNPPDMMRDIVMSGALEWEMNMVFTHRPQGWNKFPKKGETVTFHPIYNNSGVLEKPYTPVDFSVLLGISS